MSRFILIGGFLGFLITFFAGISTGRNINLVLRDAMIACLIMGIGFRFLFGQVQACALDVLEREAKERLAEEKAKEVER